MKVTNLCSGSKGNCTLISAENTAILVDIGLSYKRLTELLNQYNMSCDKIDALLLTHEHIDHVSGIAVFAKRHPNIHIFVYNMVWKKLIIKYPELASLVNIHNFIYRTPFSVGDFTVFAIENMHDSVSCATFIISAGGGKLGIATDLGIITDYHISMLSTCKAVFLECNHDDKMLTKCGYARMQQERIGGEFGHLSNEQCARAAIKLVNAKTKVVVLSHISSRSNLPELAYGCVANAFAAAGVEGTILLAYQDRPSKTITII